MLRAKARGHRDFVTVVGHSPTIAAGEWITASGEWLNDLRLECGVGFRQLRIPTKSPGYNGMMSPGIPE